MLYLGLDPGTSDNMALAAILPNDDIVVALARAGEGKDARSRAATASAEVSRAFASLLLPRSLPGILALEWQRSLPGDKNPDNIIDLSAFAGIALATIQARFSMPLEVFVPLPNEWKGEVPKHVKHNRIVALAGKARVESALAYARIPSPKDLGTFAKTFTGKASDVIDAIGLAQWARERAGLRNLLRSAILPSQR